MCSGTNAMSCPEGVSIVLLPGFQKGRDIKASYGKGQGAVLAKKGNLLRTRKNLKNGQNFTPFRVNVFP
jgi:hypothetical protein